jgi:light-regulated signal transduction histidine kinase (bacteriophytochrome)
MQNTNDEFQLYIQSLTLSEDAKADLLNYAAKYKKEVQRIDFQLKRTLKDKSIIINLLNQTIEELQLRQKEIETTNKELKHQKLLVEGQSAQLSQQLQMLEKSYAELEQFSYIASHDLKSPLRTIASYAGLLKRRYTGQLDHDAIEFIDYIIKGASHMNEIIRDLLEYAGLSKEGSIEVVDFNEITQLVVQNLAAEIKESQAQIIIPELPTLQAHRTGIMQLLQNLMGNAIKFRGNQQPVIELSAQEQLRFWQFTVTDNGLGLDESFQQKAFLPFQRISHLDRPGTGMGLAICKKIVKLHKGDIWYKSEAGKGTTFYFTLSKFLDESQP